MTATAEMEWVLWAGTLGFDTPVEARVEAALANDFHAVSIGPLDVAYAIAGGTAAGDLGRSIHDRGLDIVMDPLMGWCSDAALPGAFAEFTFDDLFAMCNALGVVSMTVFGPFSTDEATHDQLVWRFGQLCDRAADLGARVQFEFMPMLPVGDLAGAWAIVGAADRPNGGLVFDTWHFFRGEPDFSALEQIPGDRVFAVQVADAATEPAGNLGEDTFNRKIPGDGDLDLTEAVRALDRIGALRTVGPEVISPVTAAMAPVEAAKTAKARTEDLIIQSTGTSIRP